jgi:hypothetical protein
MEGNMKRLICALILLFALALSSVPTQAIIWYDQVSQYQTVLDYGTRTDGQPVYVGWAAAGTTEAQYKWVIVKMIYDDSDNFSRMIFANGNANPSKSWTLRATYTYTE